MSQIISVSQLNSRARQLLEQGFGAELWLSGEIFDFKPSASGHWYFGLKDDKARVSAVMFRGATLGAQLRPSSGQQVEARVQVSLYEAGGSYQIKVLELKPAGLGALYQAFMELKAKLQAEGCFDSHHKPPVPSFVRTVGIITSLHTAALRDVLSTLKRRDRSLRVVIYPAAVQGSGAAAQLTAALNQANQRREVEVLIVCRGGGSFEDLWEFNNEAWVRAIAASALPVVSGVGHETDHTLSDLAASVRAPTPTAAAELVSLNRSQWLAQLRQQLARLNQPLRYALDAHSQQVDFLARRLVHPRQKLALSAERLSQLQQRWGQLQPLALAVAQHRQQQLALQQAWQHALVQRQQQLEQQQQRLRLLNPTAVLKRGFAYVKKHGKVVSAASQVKAGDLIEVELANDRIEARVLPKQPSLF